MKKTYLKPEIEVTEMVVESLMAAESVTMYSVDAGSEALSKENKLETFDVWGMDETEE